MQGDEQQAGDYHVKMWYRRPGHLFFTFLLQSILNDQPNLQLCWKALK